MTDAIDLLFSAHLQHVQALADRALEREGYDGLVVYSGRPGLHFLDDHGPAFKANPHFLHWAPLQEAPDCFVRYLPGRRPQLVFHQPADYWHKPPTVPTAAWTREFDLTVIREPADARGLLDAGNRRLACIGEPPAEFAEWGFSATNPAGLLAYLHYDRAAKTPYELACMREASRLGAVGHVAAAAAYRAGASEFEVHQAYCSAVGLREQELPYGNIIAFGEGAAILHYTTLGRRRDVPRPTFLIDAGAQFRGYASDITRTHVADAAGTDPTFLELMAAMEKLQLELCAAVQPGFDYREIHLLAHRLIAGALVQAGVVTGCTAEQAAENGVSGVFFPHGIGHLLGIQVHDVAGLAADDSGRTEIPRPTGHRYLRLTRRLEPGVVVTIEPGLYFIDLLLDEAQQNGLGRYIAWDVVRRLQPYGGIRIEDDVACTASGTPENLTRDAFARIA
ncbi:MAG: Xaa-Pro dipeptidase [Proteobacteria bacterium]|nr:Xaa-Pro dipeptidase [Pseudomonadota bacterium]